MEAAAREAIIPVRSTGTSRTISYAPPIDRVTYQQGTGSSDKGAFNILGLLLMISALAGAAVSFSGVYTGKPEPMITVLFLAEGCAAILGFVLAVKKLKS